MRLKRPGDAREFDVEVMTQDERGTASAPPGTRAARVARVVIDGREIAVSLAAMPDGSALAELDGRRIRIAAARRRSSIMAAAGPFAAEFAIVEARAARRARGLAAPEVDAPMPGKVLKVLVAEGQPVHPGDALIVLEAMKMETTLYAESPAMVAKVCVAPGQMVEHGARLIELSPAAAAARPPESPAPDD